MHVDISEENKRDLKYAEDACLKLMENFDAVQIFATRHEGDKGTIRVELGRGSWFARYGHVKVWADNQGFEEPEGV